ncbi:MAG: AsmA-like C-terminal region-containing protein, partial [Candidatus Krumholzibacteriia bacterium]
DELAVRRANLSATQIDLKSDTEEFTLELRTRVFERDKLVLSGVHGTLRGGASIANGRLQAESGRLDRLQVVDLRSDVRVAGTRVELPNIEGRTYEGRLVGRAEFDLEDPTTPRYVLDVQAEDVQIGDLFAEVWSAGRLVSGKLSGTSTWKSHGADARAMRANLGAGGQGVALDGHIRDLPALTALSNFLSLPELRDLSYRDLGFSFEVASGRVLLPKLQLRGTEADLNVQGSVGLDGTLDLTLNVLLSAELSRRYVRGQVVSALGSLFTNPGGHIVLDFKVGGSFEAPQVRPDLQATASRAGVRSLNRIDLQSFLRELTQQEGTEDTIEENFEDTVEDLGRRLRDAFGGVLGDEKSRDKKSAAPDSTRKP